MGSYFYTRSSREIGFTLPIHINVVSPQIVSNYVNAIVDYCENLKNFPERGIKRDDIRSGLRTTHYKKYALIAFAVELNRVSIISIFYGGQDYEKDLKSNFED